MQFLIAFGLLTALLSHSIASANPMGQGTLYALRMALTSSEVESGINANRDYDLPTDRDLQGGIWQEQFYQYFFPDYHDPVREHEDDGVPGEDLDPDNNRHPNPAGAGDCDHDSSVIWEQEQ